MQWSTIVMTSHLAPGTGSKTWPMFGIYRRYRYRYRELTGLIGRLGTRVTTGGGACVDGLTAK